VGDDAFVSADLASLVSVHSLLVFPAALAAIFLHSVACLPSCMQPCNVHIPSADILNH
jgi:hypothetical protein